MGRRKKPRLLHPASSSKPSPGLSAAPQVVSSPRGPTPKTFLLPESVEWLKINAQEAGKRSEEASGGHSGGCSASLDARQPLPATGFSPRKASTEEGTGAIGTLAGMAKHPSSNMSEKFGAGLPGSKPSSAQAEKDSEPKLAEQPTAEANGWTPPPFHPAEVLGAYLAGNHRQALQACVEVLRFYQDHSLERVTPEVKTYVNTFVETFLYLLTKPDLRIEPDQAMQLMAAHHILAHLTAISDFKTTDVQLAMVRDQPRNLLRLLILYSVRNRTVLPPKPLFDADPFLASLWYASYPMGAVGAVTELLWENLLRHLSYVDSRLQAPDPRILGFYFESTQIAPGMERPLKDRWNADIRRQLSGVRIRNKPDPKSVAIITAKWFPGSAVYRSLSPLVHSLKGKYKLTLVHLGPARNDLDTSPFAEVRRVEMTPGQLDCTQIEQNDFQLAFFPDIGMMAESIWLSNMRLAPIQATGYGHPASTGVSEIDYFLGGAESELLSRAVDYYAERLVLLPGLGAVPTYPSFYRPTFPQRNDDAVVINLPWGATKTNYPMLCRLKTIQQYSSRPVRLHFFPAWGLNRYCAPPLFVEGLGALFGNTATVYANRPIPEYLALMEQGDLCLDSYPFGGFNTIIDALYLAKPVVVQEGEFFFNRVGAALLRRVGLEELIAHSEDEYIGKALRLVEDQGYRQSITQRLRNLDLRPLIFQRDDPAAFCRAIDYLVENHTRLQQEKGHDPIFIS
jgi:hypothetical protein